MAESEDMSFDFSILDEDEEFQRFLNYSQENEAEEIDLERCKEGIRLFNKQFLIPSS